MKKNTTTDKSANKVGRNGNSNADQSALKTQAQVAQTFDELQEQAMRAINALLNARGIPTCIKRALADSLEQVALTVNTSTRGLWRPHDGSGLNINPALLWQVFETPSVRELWDLPSKPPAKCPKCESKPKSQLRRLKRELEQLDQEFLPESDPERLQLLSRIAMAERDAARDEWPDVIGGAQ